MRLRRGQEREKGRPVQRPGLDVSRVGRRVGVIVDAGDAEVGEFDVERLLLDLRARMLRSELPRVVAAVVGAETGSLAGFLPCC